MQFNIFAGKSPTERNKIIAAIVLGVFSLFSLYLAFGGNIFSSRKTTVTVKASPSPSPSVSPGEENLTPVSAPSQTDIDFGWTTTPVVYTPGGNGAPDAGRNIFAFYEPPPPTPYSPTPFQTPVQTPLPTPEVTPTPPYLVGFVSPQSVYAGQKTFRLEVSGDKFQPDSQILFNGTALPTTFISPQQLVAEVPESLISSEGARTIIVVSPDGKYSNQFSLNVQSPPKPAFQYIGVIARKRYNNDTAYFQEQGKKDPFGLRLNDVVGGRFRLVSISSSETIFEDVNLGFRHKLALYRPEPGTATGAGSTSGSSTNDLPSGFNQNNIPEQRRQQNLGFPNNIPIYTPPQPGQPQIPSQIPPQPPNPNEQQKKEDVDDDGDN